MMLRLLTPPSENFWVMNKQRESKEGHCLLCQE